MFWDVFFFAFIIRVCVCVCLFEGLFDESVSRLMCIGLVLQSRKPKIQILRNQNLAVALLHLQSQTVSLRWIAKLAISVRETCLIHIFYTCVHHGVQRKSAPILTLSPTTTT
jgi:hypothetical protein